MRSETNDEVRRRAHEVAERVRREMEERFRRGGVVWVSDAGAPPRLMPRDARRAA